LEDIDVIEGCIPGWRDWFTKGIGAYIPTEEEEEGLMIAGLTVVVLG
jgi:hypothetical protein